MSVLVGPLPFGCATPPPAPTPQALQQSVDALVAGKPTRQQLVIQLGIPTYVFEEDRILVYRMEWSPQGGLRAMPYSELRVDEKSAVPHYQLVLVFDGAGALDRWALLER